MSKPICKSECDWIFWCDDMPMRKTKLRTSWRKKLMVRARRRFYKHIAMIDSYTHKECPQCHTEIGFSEKTYTNGRCFACDSECPVCKGSEWVCENHPDRPWDGESNASNACGCGAGMPCQSCDNTERQREINLGDGDVRS